VIVALAALLFWAARQAPLREILMTLSRLRPWQLVVLILANAVVVTLMTARWWLIVRAEAPGVPFLPLLGARLSSFALSYLTPGPQVGGEPVQVAHLRTVHSLSLARAVTSVLLDKLLEFIGNFVLIAIGAAAVVRVGLAPATAGTSPGFWLAVGALLALPALYVLALRSRRRPLRAALLRLAPSQARTNWFRVTAASEHLAATFMHRHTRALIAALTASLGAWLAMAVEYILMVRFLGIVLGLGQALVALAASLLAFLIPLPGGLGALEASQVGVLAAFEIPAAQALGLTLLLRARDLLNVAAGVILSHSSVGGRR